MKALDPIFGRLGQEVLVVGKSILEMPGRPSFDTTFAAIVQALRISLNEGRHDVGRGSPHGRHMEGQPFVGAVDAGRCGIQFQHAQHYIVRGLVPNGGMEGRVVVNVDFSEEVGAIGGVNGGGGVIIPIF